jgi:hypothetical protein
MLTAYTIYGQENDYSDLFDFQIFVDDDSNDAELGQNEVEELIKEFKEIMSVPEEERTTEQWNRAIEIIFLVYYGADLKTIFTDLKLELEKQQALNKKLSDLYRELKLVYDAEVEVLKSLREIQSGLESVFSSLDLGRSFYPFVSFGITSNIGFNAGAGLILPITDRFIIGAGLTWHYDADITKYFSFSFMFGWGF